MAQHFRWLLPAALGLLLLGAAVFWHSSIPAHPLIGAWLADDDTIFLFQERGNFIGKDWRGILIWGNWTALDDRRIGFQSLHHKGYYLPQYAVVTDNGMKYVVSDGDRFIQAKRISGEEALKGIGAAITSKSGKP